MMLDHVGFNVSDFPAAKAFLVAALAPLGIAPMMGEHRSAMLGRDGKAQFWFGGYGPSPGPIHLAFAAATREQVRQFHAAASQAGGIDNGAPGLRDYAPDDNPAFVIGPDGHNRRRSVARPASERRRRQPSVSPDDSNPPSTLSTWPVTKLAFASSRRKAIASAISRGSA